jgi:hypothetical protein
MFRRAASFSSLAIVPAAILALVSVAAIDASRAAVSIYVSPEQLAESAPLIV